MDKYGGKRVAERNVASTKGMPHVSKNPPYTKDLGVKLCSRPNCSSRIYSSIIAENSSSMKGKSLKPSTQSSLSGKEAVGRFSRTVSGASNPRKSLKEPRQRVLSKLETDSSETSSIHDEPEVLVRIPQHPTEESLVQAQQPLVEVASTSSGVSRTRSRRSGSQHHATRAVQETKSSGSATRVGGTSRHNLRNVKCNNSINDVITDCSSSSSSSDSTMNRKKDMVKRRNSKRESNSSSTRGKKLSGSSLEGQGSSSISLPSRSRNVPAQTDNVAPVRTRRSTSGSAGERRLPTHGSARPMRSSDLLALLPPMHHRHASMEPSFVGLISFPSSSSSSNWRYSSFSSSGVSLPQINQIRRQHQNSIAEEFQFLETNIVANELYLYDRHRDMRMDIDDMSYEELLALEERMGTVSTALTEEALSECLKRSTFQPTPSKEEEDDEEISKSSVNHDTKCSICQDEYGVGDELGSLNCEHGYHLACIEQWLRLKNWCPICKTSAAATSSDSSHASNEED